MNRRPREVDTRIGRSYPRPNVSTPGTSDGRRSRSRSRSQRAAGPGGRRPPHPGRRRRRQPVRPAGRRADPPAHRAADRRARRRLGDRPVRPPGGRGERGRVARGRDAGLQHGAGARGRGRASASCSRSSSCRTSSSRRASTGWATRARSRSSSPTTRRRCPPMRRARPRCGWARSATRPSPLVVVARPPVRVVERRPGRERSVVGPGLASPRTTFRPASARPMLREARPASGHRRAPSRPASGRGGWAAIG